MRKDYWKAILVFLLICSLTFFICIKINNSFGSLKSGETYTDKLGNRIYSLSGYYLDPESNMYSFDLVREYRGQQLELVFTNLPSEVLVNGKALESSFTFSRLLLSAKSFKDDTAQVFLNTVTRPCHTPIYVTTTAGATSAISIYDMIYAFSLGMTFLMFIYGISLYYRKQTEKYLLWFAIYTGALTLWSALPLFTGSNMKMIRYYAYGWCVILDIVICFKMFDIKLPRPFDMLLSKRGVVFILALWSLLETVFPILHSEICFYILFLLSIGVLVYACANRRKGAWLLLSGHAVSQGLRMVTVLAYISGTTVSFPLRAMQYSKVFNLPFAICCMLLITQLFAEKFTEAEVLAEKLEQINQNLDKKVLEGVRALEEQEKRRRSFMMNIFHDLRTPLFVMQGCTQRIANKPELFNEELPIVMERLDFTKHLVEDLFLMAKLEDKQVILETERVPLAELLQNVVSACSIEGENKEIAIKADLKGSCIAWGDEYRLKQAFQNLLLNAIYYTKPKGKVFVSLAKYRNTAVISFKDTGIGIAPQDLDKIFDRYYRVSSNEKHQSTGLGLSIAHEIIQQHQGTVSVDSKVGYGTTFTVQLPII